MATIRTATMDDIPQIVEMAKRFYAYSPYPVIYGNLSKEQAAGIAIVSMQGYAECGITPGVMLVAEDDGVIVGMLAMHIDPATYAPEVCAAESAWWVDQTHAGLGIYPALVDRAEQEAKARGATVSAMGVMGKKSGAAVKMLKKRGYTKSHVVMMKRI